jgi:hypothetical protein
VISGIFALAALAIAPAHTIPFEEYAYSVRMNVLVNGSMTMAFELDTAAGTHVIDGARADEAGVTFYAVGTATGAGDGSAPTRIARDVKLAMSGLEILANPLVAVDLTPVSERRGKRLDGLIGAPMLAKWIVEIDYDAGEMRLYDPATFTYEGEGEVLPLRVDGNGKPYVRGVVNGIDGEFLIDAPAGGNLVFAAPFAAKHALARASESLLEDEIFGVGGSSRTLFGRVAEFRLGRFVFKKPTAEFTKAKAGTLARADIAGLLGGGILHRFRVILDCPGKRLILEPSRRVDEPFEQDMSGIKWITSAPDYRELRVRAVLPGSPAAQAGVRPGDVLQSVDGKAASGFDRPSLGRYLQSHGRTVTLVLRRAAENIEFRFTLRRMI